MRRMLLLLACVCCVAVPSIHAQISPDTTTAAFRAGEWGVGFQGRGLTEAGVLRFTTPTRAWVLDGSAFLDRRVVSGAGIFGTDQSAQTISINALLGPRWYHAVNARLVRLVGFGVSGGYGHAQSVVSTSRDELWSAGAYGEIGLEYMFTRHLGLGWRGNLVGSRISENTSDVAAQLPGSVHTTHYQLTLEPVQIIGTIYF